MRANCWRWLVLLLVPGCLLVQPLDEAKSDNDGSAGSGKPSAGNGSAGHNSAGSGSPAGGSKNNAGSGPVAPGGSANGGAPSGVDFSLFLGTWTVVSGKNTVSCDRSSPTTTNATPGSTDSFELGTTSDLTISIGGGCEVLADVNDRTASLNPATSDCVTSDANYLYDLTVDAFEFVVSGNGQTAKASMDTTVVVLDANGNISNCDSDYTWDYKR